MFIATNRIKVKIGYGDTLEHMFKARGSRAGSSWVCQLRALENEQDPGPRRISGGNALGYRRAPPDVDPERCFPLGPCGRAA